MRAAGHDTQSLFPELKGFLQRGYPPPGQESAVARSRPAGKGSGSGPGRWEAAHGPPTRSQSRRSPKLRARKMAARRAGAGRKQAPLAGPPSPYSLVMAAELPAECISQSSRIS